MRATKRNDVALSRVMQDNLHCSTRLLIFGISYTVFNGAKVHQRRKGKLGATEQLDTHEAQGTASST